MGEPGITRKRKWLRRALFVGAALLIAGAASVFSGLPQKWAAEWAIERNFGMTAEIEWGGMLPDLRIKSAYLFPNAAAQRKRQPLVSAFDIRVQYQLLAGGRKVKNVDVGQILVDIDPDDPSLRELPFLKSGEEEGTQAGPTDSTFIPREIEIGGLAVRMHRVDGTFLLADEFSVKIDLANPDSAAFSVRGESQQLALDSGETHVRLADVTLEGSGRYEGGDLTWNQTVTAPGVFRLAFDVKGPLNGDDAHLDVNVAEASLKGDGLPAFLDSAAAPVHFAEFSVESATARISLGETTAATLNAAARVYALELSEAEEPLYRDAVRVTLTAENTDILNAEATVGFAKGQTAHATLRGTGDQGEASAKIDAWSRAQFEDALPLAFRESVSGLGFDSFSSDATVKWTKATYEVSGRAESKGGANAKPISWAVQAHGARDGSQSIEGTAEARLGDRRVRASAHYESPEHYLAEAVVEEVKIAPWVELFSGKEAAAPVDGTIEGTIRAEATGKDAPLEIHPDFKLKNFVYDTLKLDEITAKGALRYAQAEGRVVIDELRAEAPDGMTAIALSAWDYDVKTQTGGGAFSVGANLGILGQAAGDTALVGNGEMKGKARITGPKVEAEISFNSSYLGHGELLLPLHTDLTGTGTISYDRESRRGVLTAWRASVGEGTKLHLGDTKFGTSPFEAEGELVSESDLQVLVPMGLLGSVEGKLNETSKIRFANDTLHVDWDLRIAMPKVELAGSAGSAESVEFEGAGAYEGRLTGTGHIRAGKIMAAGGSILEASGPVLFDGNLMRIQQAKGELFRGAVNADIDIGVLTENLPIVLSGSFADADLAILTDEVKPPNTQLTGKARGTISVEYGLKGLTAFTFEAEAPEGLSVNRSLVEELLQSDKFLSGAGANVAEKAMDKLLGTAPQRPFDRGRLNVQLADEKITGVAVLESQQTKEYHGLNLRVTLDMDESALEEALKMLQETSKTSIDRAR